MTVDQSAPVESRENWKIGISTRGYSARRFGHPVPRDAVREGIIYMTEDRKVNGFFETMSVSANIFIGHLSTAVRMGFLASKRQQQSVAASFIEQSDRVLVARAGRIAAEFRIEDATQERIMFAAVH